MYFRNLKAFIVICGNETASMIKPSPIVIGKPKINALIWGIARVKIDNAILLKNRAAMMGAEIFSDASNIKPAVFAKSRNVEG